MFTTPLPQFTKDNIRFLTFNLEVNTEKLASLAQVDVSALRMFQTYGYPLGKAPEPLDSIIKLCNYFTIYLGDLLYTDIENSSFDRSIFTKLRAEMEGGAPYDREPFEKKLVESIENAQEEFDLQDSIVESLKLWFNNIQAMDTVQEILS